MQCSACRAVFSNGLDNCPRCKTSLPQQATKTIVAPQPEVTPEPKKHQESSKAARAAEGG